MPADEWPKTDNELDAREIHFLQRIHIALGAPSTRGRVIGVEMSGAVAPVLVDQQVIAGGGGRSAPRVN